MRRVFLPFPEGGNAALVVIPFTLCSLLFCRDRTRERARVAHRHHPGDPGSRPGKSPLARSMMLMSSDFRVGDQPASLQAIPSARFPAGGPGQPSTPHRFSAGPCHRCHCFIRIKRRYRCKTKYYWGFLSPRGEGGMRVAGFLDAAQTPDPGYVSYRLGCKAARFSPSPF
ncbi:hypothetical protein PUATCC27989T_04577 [Phytobacter ursingii]|nr:hypothetical protein PUATCC27989T_04577 [Phytobacter ursingii]